MESDVFELIRMELKEKKSSIELFLANGNCKTFEEYCRITGEYAALNGMEQDILDMEKRFIER